MESERNFPKIVRAEEISLGPVPRDYHPRIKLHV